MSSLHFREVTVRADGHVLLDGVTVLVEPGQLAGLVGPNGSGKSTLLRTAYRHLAPAAGQVFLGDDDIAALPPRRRARTVACLPQHTRPDLDMTVREVVETGRTPHQRPLGATSAADRRAVEDALRRTGVSTLAQRAFHTLSGGEQQRALLAAALAQATPVLLLDEPTNHLDLRHQLDLLTLIRSLGITTLMAVHDLNQAAAQCDQLHVLHHGTIAASGPPVQVLTPTLVRRVFGIDCEIIDHPRTGAPHWIFSPLHQ
ncbi:ABC transporter ATP-binding protein [Amycolatopsis magusensis]|uniref:ABC transporter ATP-binding protein n=1 Tax=Amycolatopsis magusensis TaxID=882444 RepID=UPI0037AC0249